MKAVVQKVSKASVEVEGKITGKINNGLLVLLGIKDNDDEKVIEWMSNKLVNLRIFPDKEGKLNLSVKDIGGNILLISNFTLYGDLKKGYRPSYSKAAKPDISEPIYEKMIDAIKSKGLENIQTGVFGAMMDVQLNNDGPVTVIIEKESDQ